MRSATHPVDPYLLSFIVGLTGVGFLIFTSASIGLFARGGAGFGSVAPTQLVAIALGGAFAFALSRLSYKALRAHSFLLLVLSVFATLLVFVPGLGLTHGGASRWISLFGLVSFQPAELLKFGVVLYYGSFLSAFHERLQEFRFGFLPLFVLMSISAALLLTQPDTDAFVILFTALLAMFLAAGGRVKHLALILAIAAFGFSALIYARPYLKERVLIFLNPATDPENAGYQLQQSLIAIGSGGIVGRGFGQSVQKFSYLPEPIGDSIFAVAAEEFGFIGALALVTLFLLFMLRGLHIAARAPDLFSGLLALGIVILIGAAAFLNMASMLGMVPLSGLPLSFVSHGGTALLFTLAASGVVLNISRYQHS